MQNGLTGISGLVCSLRPRAVACSPESDAAQEGSGVHRRYTLSQIRVYLRSTLSGADKALRAESRGDARSPVAQAIRITKLLLET